MSALAKEAREKMKAKAKSLAGERDSKVDSSDWSPAEPLNADAKTGARPISKRQFKKGGKVAGKASAARADRKPRKAGGRVEKTEAAQEAKALVNRNVRAANEEREGTKHVGGFNKGGRTKKDIGGTIKNLATSGVLGLGGKLLGDAAKRSDDERDQSNWRNAQLVAAMPRKAGGKAKRASGGGVKDKKALGAIDPSPKRGAAQHYKKGGKAEGGGSFLQRTIGGGEQEKREREMRDVGKSQTSNYSQEDKGALNRMLREDNALPEAGEAMERSGKFQDYKRGGKAKKAGGGRMDADYVGASSVTKDGKPVTRPKDIEDREPREPRASDLYSSDQLKRLERGYKKGGLSKLQAKKSDKKQDDITKGRMKRATGGMIDIGAMKKPAKAAKRGKTNIDIKIFAGKPQDMMSPDGMMPPAPPVGVPLPMPAPGGAPQGAPMPAAAAAPQMPPPAPGGAPMPPPGGMPPRKAGGRVKKEYGGGMSPVNAMTVAPRGMPSGGGGFKGAATGAGMQGTGATPAMSPDQRAMMMAAMQNRGNPVNTFPGPGGMGGAGGMGLMAPQARPMMAPQQFRPGAPINIGGPGIRPTQGLNVQAGAATPVRAAPVVQQPAATPAAAPVAAPQQQSNPAEDVMRNIFLARAMGLMRKSGGRVK